MRSPVLIAKRTRSTAQSPSIFLPDSSKPGPPSIVSAWLICARPATRSRSTWTISRLTDQKWDLAKDPQWEGQGNRTTFTETEAPGTQDFGHSQTNFAGGSIGELGGTVWRSTFASYADRVGPLTLNQPLVASGSVVLTGADPDSDVCFGWFRSGGARFAGQREKKFARLYRRCHRRADARRTLLSPDGNDRNGRTLHGPEGSGAAPRRPKAYLECRLRSGRERRPWQL